MIRGIVKPSREDGTGLEAWVSVAVSGGDQPFQMVEAVVDTGYTGWLMLPASDIFRFGLTTIDTGRSPMAKTGKRIVVKRLCCGMETLRKYWLM